MSVANQQCDQIGRFWKFFFTNFLTKVAKLSDDFKVILRASLFK